MILGGITGVAPWTGIGDVQGSLNNYFGLDAATSALALAGTTKSCKLRRASDDTTQDFLILSSGIMDVAGAISFGGVHTTGNATSVGTSVALTGLSGAAIAGDRIVGAGFLGTYCKSVGAFAAGSQTVTTNTSQSIGVAEAVSLYWGLFGDTFYDQIGGQNITQSTATLAAQPMWLPDGGPSSGIPCFEFQGTQRFTGPGAVNASQPITALVTAIRKANFTAFNVAWHCGGGGSLIFSMSFVNAADTCGLYAGSVLASVSSCTDSVWHVLQGVGNGGSSAIQFDTTSGSGNAGNNSGVSQSFYMGTNDASGDALTGSLVNACFYKLNVGGTTRNSISNQVHTNLGF